MANAFCILDVYYSMLRNALNTFRIDLVRHYFMCKIVGQTHCLKKTSMTRQMRLWRGLEIV